MPTIFRTAAACAVLAASVPAVANATAGDLAGSAAFGNADYIFHCGSNTCDSTGGPLSTQSQSRPPGGTAAVGFSGTGGLGGAEFAAQASLDGALATPVLKAIARTRHAFGPHPSYSTDGFYEYNASAIASAVQYYTYTGASAATYTFTFGVDGAIAGTLASIDAFAGLFDVDTTLGGELPLGQALAMDRLSYAGVDGSSTDFDDEFSLMLTLSPGQDFYLSAVLSANVGRGLEQSGLADAYHTFTASLTQGDPSLLRIGAVPGALPAPAPASLVAGALLVLALFRRHAGARPSVH